MKKYNTYYLIFYDKSKRNHIKNRYKKLTEDITRLKNMEFQLFNKKNIINDEIDDIDENIDNNISTNNNNNINQINEAKLYLSYIKNFLLSSIKEINNYENDSLRIYYVSIQNYFSVKGLLLSKKYKLLNEYEFFQKFNKEKEEYLSKKIMKDKTKMSKPIINKTENKLFNYFNYEALTSKKIIKTISTLGLLSLSIVSFLYLKKKYKN